MLSAAVESIACGKRATSEPQMEETNKRGLYSNACAENISHGPAWPLYSYWRLVQSDCLFRTIVCSCRLLLALVLVGWRGQFCVLRSVYACVPQYFTTRSLHVSCCDARILQKQVLLLIQTSFNLNKFRSPFEFELSRFDCALLFRCHYMHRFYSLLNTRANLLSLPWVGQSLLLWRTWPVNLCADKHHEASSSLLKMFENGNENENNENVQKCYWKKGDHWNGRHHFEHCSCELCFFKSVTILLVVISVHTENM